MNTQDVTQSISSTGVPSHNACTKENSQLRSKLLLVSLRIRTRCLKVETSKLNRVSGMMQRHFLAVGETAFPSFRFCSFPAEQMAQHCAQNSHYITLKLALWSAKYCRLICNYRVGGTTFLENKRLQGVE